ncbi:aminopeptidase N [Amylibacter sp. SFDW26]|uniref:aminopeptidase N n=1 Tax=Amylibacter sp. SFDW26 TaxID=2652722 RepID=UPI0012623BE7|nr:aminopeptidase N [Amylibacter sp. SFDW26]KAB7610523.1 aminopeptidase N [Amylibacter sp. SFDW26]
MRPSQAPTIRLSEYTAPAFWVDTVDLTFKLNPTATRVISKITFKGNTDRTNGPHDLQLDGRNLKLITASINGKPLKDDEILQDTEGLRIPHDLVPQDNFTWEAEVEINPEGNTALEGLYMSNGMYCTQCEAQGFRKITYYPDRPDVMATFTVAIEGDSPVLLSNGNKVKHGKWHDPWPKPAYLFALVAGDLVSYDDQFTTMSGRKVDLQIFVREGDQDKCAYAMDALIRSMKWDEEVYGREYDLDLFMIVAVDDFNMGAMENKGLNIFNSKYVLASPETATDRDYELIEGIIAHEYFHNWTGNRITCRDWFQLCLKEGLTVFRDQQFSGDMRSHAVKRIDDVLQLRSRQFREDAGPLAHPVRPEEYIEINNFYTATVYEKGAEVIGMLKLLVGDAQYDKALTLYFDRHDGQACTIEDWIAVFQDATGRDLSQFKLWYSQAGTPRLKVTDSFEDGVYTLNFEQSSAPTPDQDTKNPQVIPVRTGFLNADGSETISEQLFEVTKAKQSFTIDGFDAKPTPSILRGFSAPVALDFPQDDTTLAFLLANDSDPFNKWEAGRTLSMNLLTRMILKGATPDDAFLDAMRTVVLDENLDPAYRSLTLSLPSEDALAQAIVDTGKTPDPDAIYKARKALALAMAKKTANDLPKLYASMSVDGAYSPDAKAAGKRSLRTKALSLLTKLEDDAATARAQFANADNMTEQLSALSILISAGHGADASAAFYDQWKDDKLVIDKWFATLASSAVPETALEKVTALSEHPEFTWTNPNRFRSLIGPFAMNPAAFHRADGKGYKFVADWLIKLDAKNPQTTARMCGLFETWRRYDDNRQALIKAQLERIAGAPNLSKDSSEIVGKILGA